MADFGERIISIYNVILFGAGASYGAGEITPEPPPLGNRLYAELGRCFPRSWGNLPSDVANLFSESFEKGMAVLWDKFSTSVPILMQHMAIYFVQFRPRSHNSTHYCRFVQGIERANARSRVLFSTLNYECLLEHSIWGMGIPVNYGEFPHEGGFTVWKLHGACNLLPVGISATRGVSFTNGVSFDTPMRPATDFNEVFEYCLGDNSLSPVMCLFMQGKPVQVSAGSISEIQSAWREKVMGAKRVAVVGVCPNVEDTHVWGTLANIPGDLIYVGGVDSFETWRAQYRSKKSTKVLGDRFDNASEPLLELMVN